jgi:hypothetical protein
MKTCCICKKEKDTSEFYPRKERPGKVLSQCKDCRKKASAAWMRTDAAKLKQRIHHFKSKYGITLEQYDVLMSSQYGRCPICSVELATTNADLDHCHATGRVRGILCHNCNVAIGLLKDNADLCKAASAYLSIHAVEQ